MKLLRSVLGAAEVGGYAQRCRLGGWVSTAASNNDLWRRSVFAAMIALGMSGMAGAQNPVTDWNLIAVNTVANCTPAISPGCNTGGGAGIYLAYAHLAIYNAVNAINRRFQPYGPTGGA
jgi:hypothetical protein